MSTIIHATDPAELLGLVPALAGFTPRRSIVMLPFHGARTYGAMRVDLPSPESDPDEFAEAALHALLQVSEIDAAAVVVYTDVPPQRVPDGILLPHLTVVETLVEVLAQTGLRVVDALCVTPDGWGDYLDEEPVVLPLEDIPSPTGIPGIGDVSGDQTAGAELPAADLVQRERVGRALRELDEVLDRHRTGRSRPASGENPLTLVVADTLLDDLPAFAEDLLDAPHDEDPYGCAALLWCLNRPVLRDAILVQWATDEEFGSRALGAQLDYADAGAEIPPAVGDVFLGRGPRPDSDRLGCALQVVRRAAALAPRHAKAPALTAAAWLAWALGRSSQAGQYVDQALEIDPEYGLASLIAGTLSAAVLPEWALRRP
ncbi:DUF4192 family protein [Microbacterium sp. NPDC058342]|uniref:DUF4192 family protein n=1 Tax=Microbacterium sp. NPDC058342 TaxID=3346454 RepID=UPI0036622497